MMLKAILCVQHFCSFAAMLFIVNLLIKMDSTVFVFFVCLSMFIMSIFFEKLQTWKIYYVRWLNFVYRLKFTSLRPDLSK